MLHVQVTHSNDIREPVSYVSDQAVPATCCLVPPSLRYNNVHYGLNVPTLSMSCLYTVVLLTF